MTNNVYADTLNYPSINEPSHDGKWIAHMKTIFDAYKETNFHWVHPNPSYAFPDEWKWCKNVASLNYYKFISDMDLGVNLHYNWR